MYTYIYIYIHIHICVYIYISIYTLLCCFRDVCSSGLGQGGQIIEVVPSKR